MAVKAGYGTGFGPVRTRREAIMCGIGGILNPGCIPLEARHQAILDGFVRAMQPRGPDGNGVFVDREAGLAHTRLAILDPDPRSGQPMASGDWVLSFDGRILNHRDIRAELGDRCVFRTESDAETLLMAIGEWGLDRALKRCAGMFAFLAWNRRERALYAVRDRMGIKPLVMARLDDGSLCFASSTGAMVRATPEVSWPIHEPALASFFVLGAPFTRSTVFAGMERVPPASYLRCAPDGKVTTVRYWKPTPNPAFTVEDLIGVVREHGAADVPSALFLSGGVNSSFLASVMDLDCIHLRSPETRYAETVAGAFGRGLVCVEPDLAGYREDVSRVVAQHGEPLMSCGIPHAAARAAGRAGYKMAVSAYGADELFHGYPRTPMPGYAPSFLPLHERASCTFLNGQLAHIFRDARHFRMEGANLRPPSLRDIGRRILAEYSLPDFSPSANHRWLELMTYVLFDLNPTLDAASMAAGLEVRLPFLDHRIVEGVLSWPPERLVTARFGRKSPLREHLAGLLPEALFNRPKVGFSLYSPLHEDIASLGPAALARAEASGRLALGKEDHPQAGRDRICLGSCCFAFEQWQRAFGPEET
jgi:asparagine synthase (glutamine-hydrolysing)